MVQWSNTVSEALLMQLELSALENVTMINCIIVTQL